MKPTRTNAGVVVQAGFDFGSTDPTHALFFAARPADGAARQCNALAGELKQRLQLKGNPTETHLLHVTLQQFGEFAQDFPPSLLGNAQLAGRSVHVAPFELVFDQLVNFGSRDKPHVVLFGAGNKAAVTPLWEALGEAMARNGLRQFVRPVQEPHVTLIYGSQLIESHSVTPIRWTVTELVLLHSFIGQSRHEEEGRWTLSR